MKMLAGHPKTSRRSGFTLIELLVVIAISSILFGLLMYPLAKGFELTKNTQIAVQAQASSRQILEQVTREIQSAIYVYDNTGQRLTLPLTNENTGAAAPVNVPYAIVDLVPPKLMMHCNSPAHPGSKPRDYQRGDLAWPTCPYLSSHAKDSNKQPLGVDEIEARPITPISPSSTIVRYFVGLKDSSQPYGPPGGAFELASTGPNGFVLYRAEFSLSKTDDDGNVTGPNTDLFDLDSNGQVILNDPNFFYGDHSVNWQLIARVVGPARDVDLVSVTYSGTGAPEPNPAIKFVPNAVANDVLTPVDAGRISEGEPFAPPTTYRATTGMWTPNWQVRVYRNLDVKGTNPEVFYTESDGSDILILDRSGKEVFNITQYAGGTVPTGDIPRMMFRVNANKGEVAFDFPMESQLVNTSEIADLNANFRAAYERDVFGQASTAPVDLVAVRRVYIQHGNKPLPDYVTIIPGSVHVWGPDWTPGPNYGSRVQYLRVASLMDDPEGNQFSVNYATGEVRFDSSYSRDMPQNGDGVEISCRIQTNQSYDAKSGDIMSADYVTKNILSVQINYRIFNDRGKPQQMALTNNVLVRNFRR